MEIEQMVEKYIVEELLVAGKDERLDPEQSLLSSGVIDSLAILRLISFIEKTFDIVVEDEDVIPENFETLNIIGEYIKNKK